MAHLHRAHGVEFFGVDDHAFPAQGHRPAGIAGAAAAGDDGQFEADAALDQARHFLFGVGREHHKRVFHAPVGGIGDVRDATQAVKFDIARRRQAAQRALGFAPQRSDVDKIGIKGVHRRLGGVEQTAHHGVALATALGHAALVDFGQAVAQSVHQHAPALGVVQQIVL